MLPVWNDAAIWVSVKAFLPSLLKRRAGDEFILTKGFHFGTLLRYGFQ